MKVRLHCPLLAWPVRELLVVGYAPAQDVVVGALALFVAAYASSAGFSPRPAKAVTTNHVQER